jgi:hypothetical protein
VVKNEIGSSHQTIGDHPNISRLHAIFEKINKGIIIPFTSKYLLSPLPTVHDMIPSIRELNSQWSGHTDMLLIPFKVSQEQT